MTYEEFQEQKLEIKDAITEYRLKSLECQSQIIQNEKAIHKLLNELEHLRAEFGFEIGKEEKQ